MLSSLSEMSSIMLKLRLFDLYELPWCNGVTLVTWCRDDFSSNPAILADVATPETFLPPALARSTAVLTALLKVSSVPTECFRFKAKGEVGGC